MTAPPKFTPFGLTPSSPEVEVQIEVDQLNTGNLIKSLWFKYGAHELREYRTYLDSEVGNRNGAVSVWVADNREVIVPSRTVRSLTITVRPIRAGVSS